MEPGTTRSGPRVLVTGITGFVGRYLAERLLQGNAEVVGVSRRNPARGEAPLPPGITFRRCDLLDGQAVKNLLAEVQPDQIYHLAAYAHAGRSFQEPDAVWDANLTATRRLYDAIVAWGGAPRVLFVSSGQVYGDRAARGQPVDEDCPLAPNNPYAASKAAADLVSYQYAQHPGLDIVRARPFNHIGPRQSPQYAIASFARQLAAIECGQQAPILETGSLTPQRDLTDVRDVIAAYLLLMERGEKGQAYNVASGTSHSMQEILDRLIALTGLSITIQQQADRLRAKDLSVVRVNVTRIRSRLGWAPQRSLEQTLRDTLAYWRSELASGQ
jgi:GDP-4-dehydro-6-deoxy-D-mannose reductase